MCLSLSTASSRKNNDYWQSSFLWSPVEAVCWSALWPSRERTQGGKKPQEYRPEMERPLPYSGTDDREKGR
jgi:hypothetical protein